MTVRTKFTKPFTQQEPIPAAAIERAVEVTKAVGAIIINRVRESGSMRCVLYLGAR